MQLVYANNITTKSKTTSSTIEELRGITTRSTEGEAAGGEEDAAGGVYGDATGGEDADVT